MKNKVERNKIEQVKMNRAKAVNSKKIVCAFAAFVLATASIPFVVHLSGNSKVMPQQFAVQNQAEFSDLHGVANNAKIGKALPILTGVGDTELILANKFDALKGVSAEDEFGIDLTDSVVVGGDTVDLKKSGEYVVTYTVTDVRGNKTVASRVIIVQTIVAWVSGAYVAGDKVIYNGHIWEAKWWNTNAPSANEWKDLGSAVLNSTKLTVLGVNSASVEKGKNFDKMAGVSAKRGENDLTSSITVSGSVNINKIGDYFLTYSVMDDGEIKSISRKVSVVNNVITPDEDFGCGQGIEWPEQVFAPFVDIGQWGSGDYAPKGVMDFAKYGRDVGAKFFNIAFIQGAGGVKDDKLGWGFAGSAQLYEYTSDGKKNEDEQYKRIKNHIKQARDDGGDVCISLGGANGVPIWATSGATEELLYNTYKEIVTGFGLTMIDLDIEGSTGSILENAANARALKRLQDEMGLKVNLTLPVMHTGLVSLGLSFVDCYLRNGLDITYVNIMAMCYGSSAGAYGPASVQAIDNTAKQLVTCWANSPQSNITLAEGYAKVGVTTSIGFETSSHPLFTIPDQKLVVDHAIDKKIGMVSYWCANRDCGCQSNTGISQPNQFGKLSAKFGSTPDPTKPAPIFSGVDELKLKVGERIDIRDGVTALAGKKDVTKDIKVKSNNVNLAKAGNYSIIYEVTANEKTATATRKVVVDGDGDEPDPAPNVGWSEFRIYLVGEILSGEGRYFRASKISKGQEPSVSADAWDELFADDVATIKNLAILYEQGKRYRSLTIVKTSDGKFYQATRFVSTAPGSNVRGWREIQ